MTSFTAGAGTTSAVPRFRPLRALFDASTWRQFAFHISHLPVMTAAFIWFGLIVVPGVFFAMTWVGLVISAFLLGGAAWFATATRRMSGTLLGQPIAAPPALSARPGVIGWVMSHLKSRSLWRSVAYLFVGFFISTITFVISVGLFAGGLAAFTHPLWGRFMPERVDDDGVMHRGAELFGVFIDTVPLQVAFAAVGLLILVAIWPVVNYGLASLQRLVIRTMLGTSEQERRLAEVTASRDAAVNDADAALRRIERELHDGTQARLVGVAMSLGDARDRLQGASTDTEITALIEKAHTSTKEAIVELRALARGIHPPVLDSGLEAALASAAASTSFPVALDLNLPARPSAVVESITYFGVLELLTNAAKHAEATAGAVDVSSRGSDLVITVSDNGRGGAHMALRSASSTGNGTGLAGLQERLRSVDGSLSIRSPHGGPSSITMTMPLEHTR